MIKEFVAAWDANKDRLEEYFKTHEQSKYTSYETLLKLLIDEVINPYFVDVLDMNPWYSERITTIDDGDYQGTQLFIVLKKTFQPCAEDYFWTYQWYGSCSGCDLLMGISGYDEGLPSEEQVKEYMMLELHLLQRCKYLLSREEAMEKRI